jgi:predicted DNA binding protein
VETLTSRQRNIVEIALEEGYFDYPRRITLRQLSKKVGVSASTVSEVLRRAEKKILSAYGKPSAVQGLPIEEEVFLGGRGNRSA